MTSSSNSVARMRMVSRSGGRGRVWHGQRQVLGTKELADHTNEHGKQVIDVVTRDPQGRVIASGTTACGLDPQTAASLGGPIGPTVGDAIGLTNLDLLRQHANGEAPSGGGNFLTRRTNAVQAAPRRWQHAWHTPRGPHRLLQPEGPGINVIGGGDRPN